MTLDDALSLLEASRRENDEMRERIRQLEGALDQSRKVPLEWKLTPMETRLVGLLLARERVSRECLMTALYGDAMREEPYGNILSVMVSKVRKKLTPFDVEILGHWGQGYSIDGETRKRVLSGAPAEAQALAA